MLSVCVCVSFSRLSGICAQSLSMWLRISWFHTHMYKYILLKAHIRIPYSVFHRSLCQACSHPLTSDPRLSQSNIKWDFVDPIRRVHKPLTARNIQPPQTLPFGIQAAKQAAGDRQYSHFGTFRIADRELASQNILLSQSK